ncbi:hypothetical protein VNI00_016367 [Paramarasmius palmivorus]|uniref:Uncharacterized protein n=1 Tax=Paramarasmius palmivorus TaxID=297713 RepID=A0AAW0BEH6_9AGAR
MHMTLVAAILESGLFYSAFLIVIASILINLFRNGSSLPESDGDGVPAQAYALLFLLRAWPCIAGITSTIIIVRVALRLSLNDLDSLVDSMRAAETQTTLADLHSTRAGLSTHGDSMT